MTAVHALVACAQSRIDRMTFNWIAAMQMFWIWMVRKNCENGLLQWVGADTKGGGY